MNDLSRRYLAALARKGPDYAERQFRAAEADRRASQHRNGWTPGFALGLMLPPLPPSTSRWLA